MWKIALNHPVPTTPQWARRPSDQRHAPKLPQVPEVPEVPEALPDPRGLRGLRGLRLPEVRSDLPVPAVPGIRNACVRAGIERNSREQVRAPRQLPTLSTPPPLLQTDERERKPFDQKRFCFSARQRAARNTGSKLSSVGVRRVVTAATSVRNRVQREGAVSTPCDASGAEPGAAAQAGAGLRSRCQNFMALSRIPSSRPRR